MFKLVLKTRAEKIFRKLDKKAQQIIIEHLDRLVEDPYSSGDIKKLSGVKPNAYRLRVSRWRVVYIIITNKNTIEVVDIFTRKEKSDYRRL